MRLHMLTLLMLPALALSALGGEETPPPPAPESAAREALNDIQQDISSARLSWWKENAAPAVKFVGTYTGLGSDVATLMTANALENIWPAWKGLS